MNRLAKALTLVGVFAFCGCGPKEPTPAEGTLAGSVYRNEYFRLSVPVPSGWSAELGRDDHPSQFTTNYLKMTAAGGAAPDAPIEPRIHLLATFSTVESRLLGEKDATITLSAAERGAQGLREVEELARPIALVLGAMNPARPPKLVVKEGLVGGAGCAILETTLSLKEGTLHYRIYATARSGHSVFIETVGRSKEGLAKADAVVQALRFER